MALLRLGPFYLQERLAIGGSADVWRAVHPPSALVVAVKLLRKDAWQDRDAVAREARTVASLLHRNVVRIVDHGLVERSAVRLRPDVLHEEQPYLVMELGDATLWARPPPPRWSALARVLNELLAGLAHAHARGVIHCDLKPSNVLWMRGGRLAIADFGLARHRETNGGRHGGTPGYMAPEQLADGRDVGPWTDLYALGILARELAYVRPEGARFPLPPGFLPWLDRMIAMHPAYRFSTAAEARRGLAELEPIEDVEIEAEPIWSDAALTAPAEALTVQVPRGEPRSTAIAVATATTATLGEPVSIPRPNGPPPPPAALPIPEDWREPLALGPLHVLGAGLGLVGLRSLPVVGRERERDRLWGALRSLHDATNSRAVVLEGPSGVGKSYVVRWLAERALELGVADVVHAVHEENGVPGYRVRDAIRFALRCEGLSLAELRTRLARTLLYTTGDSDPREAEALARTLAAEEADPPPSVAERRATLIRLCVARARRRPLILWLDDLQWDAEAIELVEELLSPKGAAPIFVLATVQREAASTAATSTALARLAERRAVETITIGALPPEAHRVLVRELLALGPELADRVETRTAGNPMFAVQLVGEWAARRMLRIDASGLSLAPQADHDLIDDVHQLWRRRIDRVVEARPELRIVVELAAVLGPFASLSRWRMAADSIGLDVPDALLSRLLASHLVHLDRAERELSFAHAMVHESLIKSARDAGRLDVLHAAAADAYARDFAAGDASVADRYARHLRAAGRPHEALAPLLAGARHAATRGRLTEASSLLACVSEIRERLDGADLDRVRCEEAALRAGIHNRLGELDRAAAEAARALSLAESAGWRDLEAQALHELGFADAHRGKGDLAHSHLSAAIELFDRLGANDRLARCLRVRGDLAHTRGACDDARRDLRRALELSTAADDKTGIGSSLLGLSLPGVGDPSHARLALELFEAIGHPSGACTALNTLAESARAEGRLDDAEQLYRRARRWAQLGGATQHEYICGFNLALTLIARERFEEAYVEASFAASMAGLFGQRLVQYRNEVAALAAAAGAGRSSDAVLHLARANELKARIDHGDRDVEWAARHAAELAERNQQRELAHAALAFAAEERRRLEGDRDADDRAGASG